jgi:hypothetical protein
MYKLLIIILSLLAAASNVSAIDISINSDTQVNIDSQGLEFDDTFTLNGEVINGFKNYTDDQGNTVTEIWMNGLMYNKDVLFANKTLGYKLFVDYTEN